MWFFICFIMCLLLVLVCFGGLCLGDDGVAALLAIFIGFFILIFVFPTPLRVLVSLVITGSVILLLSLIFLVILLVVLSGDSGSKIVEAVAITIWIVIFSFIIGSVIQVHSSIVNWMSQRTDLEVTLILVILIIIFLFSSYITIKRLSK